MRENYNDGRSPKFLSSKGDTGRHLRRHDWSATPLGAPETWPSALKTLVGLLLGASQPMCIAWGPNRTWLYNDAFVPLLRRKHPWALGRPATEVWADCRDDLTGVFDRVYSGESVFTEGFALPLGPDGSEATTYFSLSNNPARDETGAVVGLFGVWLESLAGSAGNRDLASQFEEIARFFEQAPTFMAILRGAEHRFELANALYMKLVGNRPILGRTVAEALPDAVEQGYLDLLNDVFRTGKSFSASGSKYLVQVTPESPANERFVDFVYQPITGRQREVVGILVQGVDVTEHKQAEDALQRERDNLEHRVAERTAVLQNIQTFYMHSSECHAVLSLRSDGRFQYDEINPATLRLYGMTREQVIARTVDELFPAESAAELSGHLMNALKANTPYRYVRKQANSTVEATVTPVPSEHGLPTRLAVTARDVTEQQNLEQQLRQAQKMEAVGQLTGGIAHDFNNLLAVLRGSLEILQRRLNTGKLEGTERFITAAQDACRRAAALTQRLLAFSRRQTLDPRPTDVNRLIAGMEELIRHSVGADIAIEVVGAGGLWSTKIDPSQLESSLLNLCLNGRDAMAPSGGRLTIETANKWLDERGAKERELPPGQYVSLCVTDTGSGMEPAVISRAFDPFFTTKPLGEGTGLGLSMVHGFVRQSGGQVRIYSEVGKGTTVCLYLPRYVGEADALPDEPPAQSHPGAGETVLVIDDEATIRMLIIEVLHEHGYATLEARDGKSGLKILQSEARIDLLITDVGLPGGLNGREVRRGRQSQASEAEDTFYNRLCRERCSRQRPPRAGHGTPHKTLRHDRLSRQGTRHARAIALPG